MKILLAAVAVASVISTSALATPSQAVSTTKWVKEQTSWGYLSAQEIKAPKQGKCVQVPVVMDIRNVDNLPGLVSFVAIFDEFQNVIGYDEIPTDNVTNGKQVRKLKVCTNPHLWTHSSGNRNVSLTPFKNGETYTVAFGNWLSNRVTDSLDYTFKK